jgi:glutaminyl-tRNA synthetase
VPVELRLYDRLFNAEAPDRGGEDFHAFINPESLAISCDAVVEPGLADAAPEARFQFERQGYFVADRFDHQASKPVFNKTIGLRDTWQRAGDD